MNALSRIEQLRIERGWSVNELAKRSGLTQSTLSSQYSKNYNPTISTLESICAGFGITITQFFADGDEAVLLTERQKAMLSKWDALSEAQKDALLKFLDTL